MTLENKVVELLNDRGYEDLDTSTDGSDGSVFIRNGYWESINPSVLKEIETMFNVVVREMDDIEDEDCGQLYWYDISVAGYTDEELMELEFVGKYEDGELNSLDEVL